MAQTGNGQIGKAEAGKTGPGRGLSARDIADRMEDAAITLRRLPHPPGSGPKGFGSSWPDYVRDARHAYGYHEARLRVVPSAAEIARMEDAISWLMLLRDPDDRRIVWMRAEGHTWRAICGRIGVSRATAWRRWTAGLITIANVLNNKGKVRAQRGGAGGG